MRVKVMLCLALALAFCAPLRADEAQALQDAEKEKKIRQLLDMTGAAKLAEQSITQMLDVLKQENAALPGEYLTRLRQKLQVKELVDKLVPIYDKHYSTEEIDGLITFYQSPLGQKVVAAAPQIATESMIAGSAWGQAKAAEIMQEMAKEKNRQQSDSPKPNTKPKTKPAKGKGKK